MGNVYRDMRSGVIPTQEGTRLIYALETIRKALEAEKAQAIVVEQKFVELSGDALRIELERRGLPVDILEE